MVPARTVDKEVICKVPFFKRYTSPRCELCVGNLPWEDQPQSRYGSWSEHADDILPSRVDHEVRCSEQVLPKHLLHSKGDRKEERWTERLTGRLSQDGSKLVLNPIFEASQLPQGE
ncbi:hypothetical protein NDU88_003344 [Pleurodeles waltl]|uniref:Uncharacterized protein n=1 Tax=Pleurodeles waltl TaxID=8319 RepID=A0AAV7MRD5_PLEWA|nr:hypothetical protein NDU88_003344 [Pleurodeles waltl]